MDNLRFLEIARVVVRFNQVARLIVNAVLGADCPLNLPLHTLNLYTASET